MFYNAYVLSILFVEFPSVMSMHTDIFLVKTTVDCNLKQAHPDLSTN